MVRHRAHDLEAEGRPVVLVVPDQDRRKHEKRDQRGEVGIGTEQPAPAPVRHQRKSQHRRQQHQRREFRQHRQPREQAGRKPPAAIAALVQPNQGPQHRDSKGNHRAIGRDFRHQQSVIERGLRQQHRQHDRAEIMGYPPDDVGEQNLRHQHRHNAGEPHAETGVAKDRCAETNKPRDHRRMIEEGKRALLRPGPVIGLIRAQIEQAGIEHAHQRHRGNQCNHAEPAPRGKIVRLYAEFV